jgi:hypothetical protein
MGRVNVGTRLGPHATTQAELLSDEIARDGIPLGGDQAGVY